MRRSPLTLSDQIDSVQVQLPAPVDQRLFLMSLRVRERASEQTNERASEQTNERTNNRSGALERTSGGPNGPVLYASIPQLFYPLCVLAIARQNLLFPLSAHLQTGDLRSR